MSESTKIEWCDSTVNPWIGCQAVSPGCANCYAADWAKRYRRDFAQRTRTAPATWRQPVRWNAQHEDFFDFRGVQLWPTDTGHISIVTDIPCGGATAGCY